MTVCFGKSPSRNVFSPLPVSTRIGCAPTASAAMQVAQRVADARHAGHVDAEAHADLPQHAGLRLAAFALRVRRSAGSRTRRRAARPPAPAPCASCRGSRSAFAMSNRPRPMPDWLVAMTTRKPAWLSRAIASRLPGIGRHSSGDLMNWALSWLITPSRSRTMSLTARVGATASQASWTMRSAGSRYCSPRAGGELLGDVGDAVHRLRDAAQQRQPVRADRRIVGHDEHVVEEAVDGRLGAGERQRARRRNRPRAQRSSTTGSSFWNAR